MHREDVSLAHAAGASIRIGRFTYGFDGRTFHCDHATDAITLGRFCSLGRGVAIFGGGEHAMDTVSTFPMRTLVARPPDTGNWDAWSRGPTVIGHDVWLGRSSIVLSGVDIGHGAVVAAGTVVTRDVPSYTVVAGNPATVVRPRFDEETVRRLLAVGWWDWDVDRLARAEAYFGADPAVFLAAAEADLI